jgi:hypothetical protein
MQIIAIPSCSDINYYLASDFHEGNVAQARNDVDRLILTIQDDPIGRTSLLGDLMEAFWIDDPRYDQDTAITTPLKQRKLLIDKLSPIQGKIDTILMGNHERKLLNKVGNITQDICEQLKVTYGTYSSKLEFTDGFKFFITHGARAISSVSPDPIRRKAYMEFTLKRHLEGKAGDCIVMAKGHCHKLLVAEPLPQLYLITEKGKLKQGYTKPGAKDIYIPPEHRWYVSTGSFLRTQILGVSTYSEVYEYDPVEMGYCIVRIRDKKVVNVERVVV